ncbi:ATPase [Kibdelosporangium aridum]|uniref:ATPase n=1 Tax=Kibdelosporangium aridum TaxID=2030 RepID=A0A428ZAU9_KIBAR|nr:V-type ATPase 116kDa subunit family protein [Kibdelosporangium aridum]RSM85151.1 ATPase [Kibdelosporangium aridum]
MPLPEAVQPVRMQRVGLLAPVDELRDALVIVADAGAVEFDIVSIEDTKVGVAPRLARTPELITDERADLMAGEAQLNGCAENAVRQGSVAGLVGWCPRSAVPDLRAKLAGVGASLVPLPSPRGVDPPTLLHTEGQVQRSFAPMVDTYGTVPYVDVDPTVLAGVAYVVMFGMMFGDAGHGLLLTFIALLLRIGRPRWLVRLRHIWPFVAGAGLAATTFGVLYGEFFGPTHVFPAIWLDPLDEPIQLLTAAVGLGGVLLAAAYAVGTVNRWREGGSGLALYAPSGIAGSAVFLGLGLVALGAYLDFPVLLLSGGVLAAAGLVFAAIGLYAGTGGGVGGAAEAGVQVFDVVIRLGSNLVSFARLAAFGMTHAALGLLVWQGTTALTGAGWLGVAGAVIVFLVGNAVTFCLEALVAGVQALRLEFYELFSRVFEIQGRPFRPWHVPMDKEVTS